VPGYGFPYDRARSGRVALCKVILEVGDRESGIHSADSFAMAVDLLSGSEISEYKATPV